MTRFNALIRSTSSLSPAGLGSRALFDACSKGETLVQQGLAKIPKDYEATLRKEHPDLASLDVSTLFSVAMARTAMEEARWDFLDDKDDVLIIASTVGLGPVWEKVLMESFVSEQGRGDLLEETLFMQPIGNLLEETSKRLGFGGRAYLLSSACTAGTQALGIAARMLRDGRARRCLVGGVELLCQLTTTGFTSLKLLGEDTCKPFDQERKNINLSECASFVCMERSDSLDAPSIEGFGTSSDAFHPASPEPEGRGIGAAMKLALEDADRSPSDIGWVHAHGTGSPANDSAEAKACQEVLGTSRPMISSTKGIHGHSLAASGVLELTLINECLSRKRVLGNKTLQRAEEGLPGVFPSSDAEFSAPCMMKNTLGFGGVNASLVIGAASK